MKRPSHETIARRAYAKWEQENRPTGRDRAHWLAAEAELSDGEFFAADESAQAPESLHLHTGPEVSNLDRALPVEERRRMREERNPSPGEPPPSAEHFVVVLDHARVRIYRTGDPHGPSGLHLGLEQSYDVPAGREAYFANESDQAGRFPEGRRAAAGGSIDERLPMQREHERRVAGVLASIVEEFLRRHPDARWDFAAPGTVYRPVWDRLPAAMRERVGATLMKDLVNLPVDELRVHLVGAYQTAAR